MGTDAEIFVFDYDAYVSEVVPAFSALLREGTVVDWLRPLLKRRELKPELWERNETRRIPEILLPDFSCAGPYDLECTYSAGWGERWSMVNAGRPQEPAASEAIAEELTSLFQIAVSVKSLGESQFVGRSWTTNHYAKTLFDFGVKEDDRLVELLGALGKRGFIIGYQFGAGFEGINGWLDPSETADLANRLEVLRLPRYEASFAAMERFRIYLVGYECPGFSFEELSLSFVRTTAHIAAAQNRGLLWGNGVMSAEFYLQQCAEAHSRAARSDFVVSAPERTKSSGVSEPNRRTKSS